MYASSRANRARDNLNDTVLVVLANPSHSALPAHQTHRSFQLVKGKDLEVGYITRIIILIIFVSSFHAIYSLVLKGKRMFASFVMWLLTVPHFNR